MNTTWLTVKQTAAYLNCSKPTVYRLLKHYNITTTKLIGKTLISKESIDATLTANVR